MSCSSSIVIKQIASVDSNAWIDFFKQVKALNRMIIDYNLIAPLMVLQWPMDDVRAIFIRIYKLQ